MPALKGSKLVLYRLKNEMEIIYRTDNEFV